MNTKTKEVAGAQRESFTIRLLRKDYPESLIPTPVKLSEDHLIQALDLLTYRSQGKSAREGVLKRRSYEHEGPAIVVTSSHDGDSGGFSSNDIDVPITRSEEHTSELQSH